MSRRFSGGLVRLSLACAIVIALFAGVALAAGNSVHVHPPADAKVSVPYSVTMKGETALPERLYLFVDLHKCGATPAVEHRRANGEIWNLTGGKFKVTAKGWLASRRGQRHACAYIQKLTAPVNGGGGVVAHASASYRIH